MRAIQDTIVAIGSPSGSAPRALVRLSGPAIHAVLAAMGLTHLTPRCLTPGRLRLDEVALPALAAVFDAPATYTGQPMAELQFVGNPTLARRVVRRCLDAGARPAEPGEFTFRAFLAGKLDLTQAQGVADTIAAQSDAQLRAAAALREGALGRTAARIADDLANLLALVEAGIDFTDQEDVTPIAPRKLEQAIVDLRREVDSLLRRSAAWSSVESLPRVVLVGRPNAGKSTLFNALLGRPRALVSAIPGATRDVLEEPITLGDAQVMLCDLAGLDKAITALDHDVQAAARRAIDRADLVLLLHPAEDEAAPRLAASAVLLVRSKDDAGRFAGSVSAATGRGLAELRLRIADRVLGARAHKGSEAAALHPRHERALRETSKRLAHALRATSSELTAAELRGALDALGELTGRCTADDLLGRVFARFCIGK